MLNLLKNHFSKHFVNHMCGTLSDVRLIIASYLLMKENRAGCWLGNTLLASGLLFYIFEGAACSGCDEWSAPPLLNSDPDFTKELTHSACVSGITFNTSKENSSTFRKIKLHSHLYFIAFPFLMNTVG